MKYLSLSATLLITSLYFLTSASAQGAEAPRVYFERAGNFGVKVLIDSEDPVNAYDIEIVYTPGIAEVESLDTSRSLITVLPQPIAIKGGVIAIKGGSLKAFSGKGGELLTIATRPVSEGILQFTVGKSLAYHADGTGLPATLSSVPLALRVTPDSFAMYEQSRVVADTELDHEPPHIATVSVEENPLQYGERLIVFTAVDADSGVARYEARDRFWFLWSEWRDAVNPYPVTPGAWATQLKAIDYSGNAALATVYQFGNAIWKVGLVFALLGLVVWGLLTLRRRRGSV